MERTLSTLCKYEDLPVEEICKNLLNDLTTFIGTMNQFDDITMLCFEYHGNDDKSTSITIPAEVNKISEGIDPIIQFLKELEVDSKITYKIQLCLEEILTNVASYAYAPNEGNIIIQYSLSESPRMIEITIIDEGKAFNPLESENPDITLPVEERQIGGLGLFIVKKTMDEIKYDRKNNKNVLMMKKKI